MFSAGMFAARAFSMAARRRALPRFPFTVRASIAMALACIENTVLFLASSDAFLFFICDHLLCPDMRVRVRFFDGGPPQARLPARQAGIPQTFWRGGGPPVRAGGGPGGPAGSGTGSL